MSTALASSADETSLSELKIRPLQPTIGAEIHGVDISKPLTAAQRDAIKAAILDYKVVFFRDQTLDKQGQADFARQFGPLYDYPSATSDSNIVPIHKISAAEEKKRDRGHQPEHLKDIIGAGDYYHTDTSWRLVPAWGAVLRAIDLPPIGGDTIWVDANLAYIMGSDGRLWQELGDRSRAVLVDGDLAVKLGAGAFQFASTGDIEGQTVYLLDRKHGLWAETMPSARGGGK